MDRREIIQNINLKVYHLVRLHQQTVCKQNLPIDFHSMIMLEKIKMLDEGEGISIKKLVETFHFSKPAASKIIGKLEKNGYVDRIVNPDDKRSCLITINEETQKLMKQSNEQMLKLFDSLTIDELNHLSKVIDDLTQLLSKMKGETING